MRVMGHLRREMYALSMRPDTYYNHRCRRFAVVKELKRSLKKVYRCKECGMITLVPPPKGGNYDNLLKR